jgi:hypothetical protein
MHKKILSIVILIIPFLGFAQTWFSPGLVSGESALIISQRGVVVDTPVNLVSGSFYLSETFEPGRVRHLNDSAKVASGFFVYDIMNDGIIMSPFKDGSDAFYIVADKNLVVNFSGRSFQYREYEVEGENKKSFVEIVGNLDSEFTLGVVHSAKLENRSVAGNSSYAPRPALLVNKFIQFMLIDGNGVAVKLENNKEALLASISNKNRSMVKKYIESNNIRFEDDFKGLIATSKYYASL